MDLDKCPCGRTKAFISGPCERNDCPLLIPSERGDIDWRARAEIAETTLNYLRSTKKGAAELAAIETVHIYPTTTASSGDATKAATVAGPWNAEPQEGTSPGPLVARIDQPAASAAVSSDKQVSSLDARIADLIDRLDRKLKYPVIHPSAKWTRLGAEAMIVLAEAGSALSARGATEQEPIAWRWRNKGGQWWYREDAPANPPAVPLESDAVIEPLYALPWSQYVNCQSPNEKK